MSIAISPELEARLRARAQAEGLTVEAYIERIARDDQQAEEELEALAIWTTTPSTLLRRLISI